jgi:TonB family protein
MAHRPTQGTDSAKPSGPKHAKPEDFASQSASFTAPGSQPPSPLNKATDLVEVAAKFAAHGGGKIPTALSGELALDLVLNEIVEQACLATGASSAAIALRRGDDIVCRATCGTNAPELGTRLQKGSGLSGACVRTGKIQSCDDAWNDDRANPDLSRLLGVRSVVVYPVVGGEELLGILEILSPLPSAFVAADLETLEALADRIAKNAEAAREISLVPENALPVHSEGAAESARPSDADNLNAQMPLAQTLAVLGTGRSLRETSVDYVIPRQQRRKIDWVTAAFCAIILTIALVMGAAFGVRVGWLNVNDRRNAHSSPADSASVISGALAKPVTPSDTSTLSENIATTGTQTAPTYSKLADKKENSLAEGTLFVYEDGKEIFRMPSASGHKAATGSKPELISRVEPEYPAQALAQHIQGSVIIHVQVGTDGRVQQVRVATGDPLLADAAVAAVRQWRFKPYISNGQPAETEAQITLKFTLPAN